MLSIITDSDGNICWGGVAISGLILALLTAMAYPSLREQLNPSETDGEVKAEEVQQLN